MRLSVTKNDIKRGKQEDGEFCPIACALRRELSLIGDVTDIDVSGRNVKGSVTIPIKMNGKHLTSVDIDIHAALPKQADKFIELFDEKGRSAVKPTTFSGKTTVEVMGRY